MSLLNEVNLGPIGAKNHMQAKKFNAPGTQPSVKKRALADVKNTLHQKVAQHSTKPSTLSKPSTHGGKQIFTDVNAFKTKKQSDKENNLNGPVKDKTLTQNKLDVENNCELVKTCKCDEIPEDYDEDMLFENFKLTKSQIEAYALNWENTPVLTIKDMRPLFSMEDLKPIELDSECISAFDARFEDFPEITIPQLEISVPPVLPEDEMFMDGSFDYSMGL